MYSSDPDLYSEALRVAAAAVGGEQQLARCLGVDGASLLAWLSGAEAPPAGVFMDALDVISDGAYYEPHTKLGAGRIELTPPR